MPLPPAAPAKVNLFLHVGSPRADGYHPIESLVAFADCGDELQFERGGDGFSIHVGGPYAAAAGEPADNLVLKAARALRKRNRELHAGRFTLTKNLPAGAGLGGGSSDAAAALRLLAKDNSLEAKDAAVLEAALETGADVAVCLERKARLISGIGEVLSEPVSIPALHAVLVWPGAPASTPAVYRAYDTAEIKHSTKFGIRAGEIPLARTPFLEFLAKQNNDLTRAAWHVTPHIAEANAALRAAGRAILIRMSGSGSAIFAIYDSENEANAAAAKVARQYPHWWVKAVALS